jgi:GDP-L-fucose synthase
MMSGSSLSVFPLSGKRVWIAGHSGMVGSALVRRLQSEDCELLTVDRSALDLRRQGAVEKWVNANRPEAVFIAAATVGGIQANASRPAEFIHDNLAIAANIIAAAANTGVKKLMFLGAACLYPRLAPQPITESSLLEGPPEPTNEWYTVAKIAGVKLCQAFRKQHGCDFISIAPTNLYGPGDRFDREGGHVVASLLMRACEAKANEDRSLVVWGTGNAIREFMHVDDCADALVFLMQSYSDERLINIGTGEEVSMLELARVICKVVGYPGELEFDTSKPDGMPRKSLDSSRIHAMGWRHAISLEDGLARTYHWFLRQHRRGRAA